MAALHVCATPISERVSTPLCWTQLCPDYFDTDPASWNEPVWRKAAYVARSDDDDEGYFEPISDHNMTVAEIEASDA